MLQARVLLEVHGSVASETKFLFEQVAPLLEARAWLLGPMFTCRPIQIEYLRTVTALLAIVSAQEACCLKEGHNNELKNPEKASKAAQAEAARMPTLYAARGAGTDGSAELNWLCSKGALAAGALAIRVRQAALCLLTQSAKHPGCSPALGATAPARAGEEASSNQLANSITPSLSPSLAPEHPGIPGRAGLLPMDALTLREAALFSFGPTVLHAIVATTAGQPGVLLDLGPIAMLTPRDVLMALSSRAYEARAATLKALSKTFCGELPQLQAYDQTVASNQHNLSAQNS